MKVNGNINQRDLIYLNTKNLPKIDNMLVENYTYDMGAHTRIIIVMIKYDRKWRITQIYKKLTTITIENVHTIFKHIFIGKGELKTGCDTI